MNNDNGAVPYIAKGSKHDEESLTLLCTEKM